MIAADDVVGVALDRTGENVIIFGIAGRPGNRHVPRHNEGAGLQETDYSSDVVTREAVCLGDLGEAEDSLHLGEPRWTDD